MDSIEGCGRGILDFLFGLVPWDVPCGGDRRGEFFFPPAYAIRLFGALARRTFAWPTEKVDRHPAHDAFPRQSRLQIGPGASPHFPPAYAIRLFGALVCADGARGAGGRGFDLVKSIDRAGAAIGQSRNRQPRQRRGGRSSHGLALEVVRAAVAWANEPGFRGVPRQNAAQEGATGRKGVESVRTIGQGAVNQKNTRIHASGVVHRAAR